jgi:hypothetical protein
MLIGFVGMALFGLICLFLVSLYQRQGSVSAEDASSPAARAPGHPAQ